MKKPLLLFTLLCSTFFFASGKVPPLIKHLDGPFGGIKSATLTYNDHGTFVLWRAENALYMRAIHEDKWQQIEWPFADMETITRITADGDNLMLLGESGQLYYAKTREEEWKWIKKWGMLRRGPLFVPNNLQFLSASHASKERYYVDAIGKKHSNILGITSVYAYDPIQNTFTYSDPFFRRSFSLFILPPYRRNEKIFTRVKGFTVSASNLFLLTTDGEFFTTLKDYDKGDNPFIPIYYTANQPTNREVGLPRDENEELPRNLFSAAFKKRWVPFSHWISHGKIPHLQIFELTGALGMRPTGPNGSRDFELCAEGYKDGILGVYCKMMAEKNWNHRPYTQAEISFRAQDIPGESSPSHRAPLLPRYQGTIEYKRQSISVDAEDFSFSRLDQQFTLWTESGPISAEIFFDYKMHMPLMGEGAKATICVLPSAGTSESRKILTKLFGGQKDLMIWSFFVYRFPGDPPKALRFQQMNRPLHFTLYLNQLNETYQEPLSDR